MRDQKVGWKAESCGIRMLSSVTNLRGIPSTKVGVYMYVRLTSKEFSASLLRMSWLDSSFSFAKTALSQAQKSIDKVLDIKEGQDSRTHPDLGKYVHESLDLGIRTIGVCFDWRCDHTFHLLSAVNNSVVSTTASVSPPSSTASETTNTSTKTQSTPDPPAKSSSLSTWFSPSQSEPSKQSKRETQGTSSATPVAEKSSSSVLGSTWGAGDSFWGSYFGTPSTSNSEGGSDVKKKGSGDQVKPVKEAPKTTSMTRGAGARKSKSPVSPSTKPGNSEQRKKVASPKLSSPPTSTSTPLHHPRDKSNPVGRTIASSTPSSRPRHTTTPRTSLNSQQPSKVLTKVDETAAEADSSGGEPGMSEVKARKLDKQGSTTSAMSGVMVQEDTGEEATDDASTAAGNGDTPVVIEQNMSSHREVSGKQPDAVRTVTSDDSKAEGAGSAKDNSLSDISPPQQSTVVGNSSQTSLQSKNTGSHLPTRNGAQEDSTETKQAAVEQKVLAKPTLETNQGSDPVSEPSKQDKQITGGLSEQPHGESKEEPSVKVSQKSDSLLHQVQTPSDQQTQALRRNQDQSSAEMEVGKGERRLLVSEQSTSPKEEAGEDGHQHTDIDRLRKVNGVSSVVCVCMYTVHSISACIKCKTTSL